MPKNKLFGDDESEEENDLLKTENEYAKRYDNWRQKEELHKLEQKYGDHALNSDGALSSDSEDEEPPKMSEQQEEQFLKTLALLKTKDPRIYDSGYKFFDEGEQRSAEVEPKVEKKSIAKKEPNSLAAAFAESEDEDSDGEIFKVEVAAPEPQTSKKEEKIKAYLTGAVQHVDETVERDLAPLKALWSDPKLSEGEAFLRDYILNSKNLEDGDIGSATDKVRDDEALEADEQLVEEQGKFERAYNFRFEEPDQEYLKRYPRTMNYIRPKDDSRSKKRVEVRSRKEEEKRRKMEELARLKALKLKEIQEKLAKIREVTGNDELAFKDEDIEGDFDPEEHDRRMRAIFDAQYYQEADDKKPVFPDLDEELEIENWDSFEPTCAETSDTRNDDGPNCEDDDFNMDADYDPKKSRTTLLEEIQETLGKKRRNRKKKSKLAEVLSQEKPTFIPDVTDKSYDEYMEEYYKMDCEDVIAGDLPTRFKYRETVPNSFGLTVEEILLADDKELNRWASLKKTVKYRPEQLERGEAKTYSQRAADLQLKRKMLPSLFKDLPEEPEVIVPVENKQKKNKSKKKSNKTTEETVDTTQETSTNGINNNDLSPEVIEASSSEATSKKKKKKNNSTNQRAQQERNNEEVTISKTNTASSDNKKAHDDKVDKVVTNQSAENKKKKRKKKKKPKQNNVAVDSVPNEGPSQNGVITANKTPTANKNKNVSQNEGKSNNLKRKLDNNETEADKNAPKKKKKKANKQNKPQNGTTKKAFTKKLNNKNGKNYKGNPDNPLSKLSDERLKAYGLNPKKYRSFLKYKKF